MSMGNTGFESVEQRRLIMNKENNKEVKMKVKKGQQLWSMLAQMAVKEYPEEYKQSQREGGYLHRNMQYDIGCMLQIIDDKDFDDLLSKIK